MPAALGVALACLAAPPAAIAERPEPLVYTVRVSRPSSQRAEVEVQVPTGRAASVEMMMPLWSPGFYRVEDYASRVEDFAARSADGAILPVEKTRPNRWRIGTKGAPMVFVTYRLLCDQRSVTTNWISEELGVLNGAATFITLVEKASRPHHVKLERPPGWKRAMTGLEAGPGYYRAADYDELVDSPIVAGDLSVHEFKVAGTLHALVDAGERGSWDGRRAATDLARMVSETRRFWGVLPYKRYVFLNVFRPGGGGLEHASSTLLTASPEKANTPEGYMRWLGFVSHEYFHAFNVKRLRPVELGPFDYETAPRTKSLWVAEGLTNYGVDLVLSRSGLYGVPQFLKSLSSAVGELQGAPGRLQQTLEQSSEEVWNNSLSGINPASDTVSYYVKGHVVGFLLDAKVRRATGGRKSLRDVMRLAYARYSGERGFTPEEFEAIAQEVAGEDLTLWFHRAVASTEELDYAEALDWFGLRFAAPGPAGAATTWTLEPRPNATRAQRSRLKHP